MTTAAELMDKSRLALEKNAGAASSVGAVYKFVLDGEGGGTWVVDLRGSPSITSGDEPADCTIKMAASDYVDLLEGRTQGQDLFFAGKMQIEGDMTLALKLQALSEIMI